MTQGEFLYGSRTVSDLRCGEGVVIGEAPNTLRKGEVARVVVDSIRMDGSVAEGSGMSRR